MGGYENQARKQLRVVYDSTHGSGIIKKSRPFHGLSPMNADPVIRLHEDQEHRKKRRKGNQVKIGVSFSESYVEKDYGTFAMSFQRLGGFKKYVHKLKIWVEPSIKDILRFRLDVYNAAQDDDKVAEFLREHFNLMFRRL